MYATKHHRCYDLRNLYDIGLGLQNADDIINIQNRSELRAGVRLMTDDSLL